MDKFATGQSIADKLNALECGVDDGMLGAAQLMQSIVEARHTYKLSPAKVQVALTRTAEAVAALTEARRAASAAHAALDALWRENGDRATAVGGDCPFTCPSGSMEPTKEAGETPLRIVG